MEPSLENQLKQRIRNRRMTEALLCVLFLAVAIGFMVAYEESRVVEELGFGPFKYQSVTYHYDLGFGVLAGALGLCFSGSFLLVDLCSCRLTAIQVGNDQLLFYRGLIHTTLYVNGKANRACGSYYLEAPLSDGTKATVSLSKWSAHITFANGHPAVDI